jgi:hypothetical protein
VRRAGVNASRPFLLPLFTQVPRIGFLGSCRYFPTCFQQIHGKNTGTLLKYLPIIINKYY